MTFVCVMSELVIVGFHRKSGLGNEAHVYCEEPLDEVLGARADVFVVEVFGLHVSVVECDCSFYCCDDDVEGVGRVARECCDC